MQAAPIAIKQCDGHFFLFKHVKLRMSVYERRKQSLFRYLTQGVTTNRPHKVDRVIPQSLVLMEIIDVLQSNNGSDPIDVMGLCTSGHKCL